MPYGTFRLPFVAAALALLSGCGGSAVGTNISPETQFSVGHALSAQRGNGPWLYTAQLYGNDVGVYHRNGLQIMPYETLGGSDGIAAPWGTRATADGWWYVANSGHSNILVFKTRSRGPVGPVQTLDDYGRIPDNVDVDGSRKLVVVSNFGTSSKSGSLSVYLNRQTEPTRVLTYGTDLVEGIGVAIDHRGNCYWSFNDLTTNVGEIVEFAGCNGYGYLVVASISSAGGIAFDQRDNLYYIDESSGLYKCTKHVSMCRLFVGIGGRQLGEPTNVNFDHEDKYLWVSDATGYIDAIDPKTGELYKFPATFGAPYGIAPAPGGG